MDRNITKASRQVTYITTHLKGSFESLYQNVIIQDKCYKQYITILYEHDQGNVLIYK